MTISTRHARGAFYAVLPQEYVMPHTPPLILVSDHDEMYLALMEELLTEEGYQVQLAHTTRDAYQFVVNEQPDVIVLDVPIMTPDSVWTTLNMLQLNPQTMHTPALICSTNIGFMHDMQEHLEAMGCETLAKPFHLEDMLVKLRTLLRQSPAAGDA